MPPAPEIPHGSRRIWVIKVLWIFKSDHLAESNRHVGVGREVQIQLQHVAYTSKPCSLHTWTKPLKAQRQKSGGKLSEMIRENRLFGKSHDKSECAVTELFCTHRAVIKSVLHLAVTGNGSLRDLMEIYGIKKHLRQWLCRNLPAVNVRDIGNQFKCIKGYSKRQHDVWHGECIPRDFCRGPYKKSCVFKDDQNAQKNGSRDAQPGLGMP